MHQYNIPPFNHGFKNLTLKDVDQITAYKNALEDIKAYIREEVKFDPKEKTINASLLLYKIESTETEINELAKEAGISSALCSKIVDRFVRHLK